jgi:hypothetical protein
VPNDFALKMVIFPPKLSRWRWWRHGGDEVKVGGWRSSNSVLLLVAARRSSNLGVVAGCWIHPRSNGVVVLYPPELHVSGCLAFLQNSLEYKGATACRSIRGKSTAKKLALETYSWTVNCWLSLNSHWFCFWMDAGAAKVWIFH